MNKEKELTEAQKEALVRVSGKLVELFKEMGKSNTVDDFLENCEKVEKYLDDSKFVEIANEIDGVPR